MIKKCEENITFLENMREIALKEIKTAVPQMKSNKSPGKDVLNVETVKCNRTICNGIFKKYIQSSMYHKTTIFYLTVVLSPQLSINLE